MQLMKAQTSMKDRLDQFVRDCLESGQSKDEINRVLEEAGWNRDAIAHALESYSDVTFVVPVPAPKSEFHAKEAFQYLVSFITLYISAFSFGALLYSFIDIAFYDSSDFGVPGAGIPMSIAALIVAYPIYVYFTWRLFKEERQDYSRNMSSVGRWLTYLTLVVTASVIIGDLIALIFSFITGGVALTFVLKVLVVLLITGTIFLFYRWRLKKGEERESLSISN